MRLPLHRNPGPASYAVLKLSLLISTLVFPLSGRAQSILQFEFEDLTQQFSLTPTSIAVPPSS